jgi:hypothetical protein
MATLALMTDLIVSTAEGYSGWSLERNGYFATSMTKNAIAQC